MPPGVKAVWDPAKAFRETTPTRERLCINGLWRWQPAADNALQVPDRRLGLLQSARLLARHPGLHAERLPDALPRPSWKNTNSREVQSAWYQRKITIPKIGPAAASPWMWNT